MQVYIVWDEGEMVLHRINSTSAPLLLRRTNRVLAAPICIEMAQEADGAMSLGGRESAATTIVFLLRIEGILLRPPSHTTHTPASSPHLHTSILAYFRTSIPPYHTETLSHYYKLLSTSHLLSLLFCFPLPLF